MPAPELPPVESAPSSSWIPADESPIVPGGGYRVKPGDNLWDIAKKLTGNGANWQKLYAANKALIGKNPDLIQPGMQLVLP